MQNAEALNEATDSGVPEGQRGDRVRGAEPGRTVPVGGASAGGAGVRARKARSSGDGSERILGKMTGLSLPQVTRLDPPIPGRGVVKEAASRRRRFPRKYTDEDVALLAEVDRAHERLSGPATVRILKREHEQYGKAKYARLAGISVAHLYNLRGSAHYRKLAAKWEPTRPSAVAIGERRRPDPQGRPGFLRIDTVHQGDWDGVERGVSHQRRGYGDAVAGSGLRGQDQRAAFEAGGGSDAASVSLSRSGVSFRQRLGVRQLRHGRNCSRIC